VHFCQPYDAVKYCLTNVRINHCLRDLDRFVGNMYFAKRGFLISRECGMNQGQEVFGDVDVGVVMNLVGQHVAAPQTFTVKDVITDPASCAITDCP